MMPWELFASAALNGVIAWRFASAGDWPMVLVFVAYAVACFGFAWKVTQ